MRLYLDNQPPSAVLPIGRNIFSSSFNYFTVQLAKQSRTRARLPFAIHKADKVEGMGSCIIGRSQWRIIFEIRSGKRAQAIPLMSNGRSSNDSAGFRNRPSNADQTVWPVSPSAVDNGRGVDKICITLREHACANLLTCTRCVATRPRAGAAHPRIHVIYARPGLLRIPKLPINRRRACS